MRWLNIEYLLKGIFLGLLLFAALRAGSAEEADWPAVGRVALGMGGGLAVALAAGVLLKLREGYKVQGNQLPAFLLFVLLETPRLIYAGILFGLTAGVWTLRGTSEDDANLLPATVAGGLVLGVAFGVLQHVKAKWTRIGLCFLLACLLLTGALYWFSLIPDWGTGHPVQSPAVFGVILLLGVPVFYLLTFSGHEEESEIEIGAIYALLGVGLFMIFHNQRLAHATIFLVVGMLYLYYTTRVLPGLKVFKHTMRGLSYARVGRYRQALQAFRRALQLDPRNKLAQEEFWALHQSLNLEDVARDPETLKFLDLDLCVRRAGALLLEPGPSPERLGEAHRLLDVAAQHRPDLLPTVDYWRTVAFTHARQFDQAAEALNRILDSAGYSANQPQRHAILLQTWELALLLHDEMRRRVGLPQLAKPGRRLEAIGAVERRLADAPDDAQIWNLKRLLYQDVSEAEYEEAAGAPGVVVNGFDHSYAQQLGLALIDDPARWQRGGEFLRMAARGLPSLGPSIFVQIAKASEREGNIEGAWHNYELARRAGRSVGPKNLGDEDRQAYFGVVKMLAETAQAKGDLDAAIENMQLYSESERSGLETLRTLAALHEQKGDALSALRVTEQALIYNPRDADLLQRKDRYYYSVMPATFRENPEAVPKGFDLAYCLTKARTILNARELAGETLDWALHLIELALAVKPESLQARVLLVRALLRRGERETALPQLEQLRTQKPEHFESSEDEEAWYLCCRLLGDLYLNEVNRPDLAVPCYQDFRKSSKSGADTSFKLGQAYEQLGDYPRATKCYQQVMAFDGHPLARDAREALGRLKALAP
jgi:tetratricopeptide (TPR) repeat protein